MYNYLKKEENNFAENFVDFFLISHWFNIDRVQGDGCSCMFPYLAVPVLPRVTRRAEGRKESDGRIKDSL